MNYGPFDYVSALARREIRVGIVGTPQTVEGVEAWFDRCRAEIVAKESRQPHLFPRFPGFNPASGFRSTLVMGVWRKKWRFRPRDVRNRE